MRHNLCLGGHIDGAERGLHLAVLAVISCCINRQCHALHTLQMIIFCSEQKAIEKSRGQDTRYVTVSAAPARTELKAEVKQAYDVIRLRSCTPTASSGSRHY